MGRWKQKRNNQPDINLDEQIYVYDLMLQSNAIMHFILRLAGGAGPSKNFVDLSNKEGIYHLQFTTGGPEFLISREMPKMLNVQCARNKLLQILAASIILTIVLRVLKEIQWINHL